MKFWVSLFICFSIASSSFAGRVWVHTPIEFDEFEQVRGQRCAIAMRSGNTWPVVAYSQSSISGTALMTPVGWQSGYNAVSNSIKAATSNDGTIGFASSGGSVSLLNSNGWSVSNFGAQTDINVRPSLAFNSNGTPAVLHNDNLGEHKLKVSIFNGIGWLNDTVGNSQFQSFNSQRFAMSYDSYNQMNIAFANGPELMAGLKGSFTGYRWDIATIKTNVNIDDIDMAMGKGDVPFVLYRSSQNLFYASYDRQSNEWVTGLLDSVSNRSGHFSVASDSLGGVGVAYVGMDNSVKFAYNSGIGGWEIDSAIAISKTDSDVGLAFDAENLPVITYSNDTDGNLWLAYDPIVVPEPLTITLLLAGSFALVVRKKS